MTKEFGDLVRSYMLKAEPRVTVRALGSQIGYDKSMISRIMTGFTEPKARVAIKIAEALHVPEEQRAEFFLLAGGFSLETAREALKQAK